MSGDSCMDFLDGKIREIYDVDPDTPITEEFLRERLDEVDKNATSLDPGHRRRHTRMRLVTDEAARKQLEESRSIRFSSINLTVEAKGN